jgi:hypothetical protein
MISARCCHAILARTVFEREPARSGISIAYSANSIAFRRHTLMLLRPQASQARRIPIIAGTQRCHPPLPRPHQRKPRILYLDQGPKQNHRRRQTRAPSVRLDPLGWFGTPAIEDSSDDRDIGTLPATRRSAKSQAVAYSRVLAGSRIIAPRRNNIAIFGGRGGHQNQALAENHRLRRRN